MRQYQNLSNEGVHILPVKSYLGPHQYLCSPQGSSPVKIKRDSNSRKRRVSGILACLAVALFMALSAGSALAQQSQNIDQIRVIGNRRIPKETILARLFTHPGDPYDRISIERDFNSLWNTGYFEDLRIEREDTEKGIILNIFVRERPIDPRDQLQGEQFGLHVRYSRSLQKGEGRAVSGRPVRRHQGQAC